MDYEDEAQEPFLHQKDEEMNIDLEIQSKIREGFIYKVFGIVLYQLIILFIMVYLGFTFKYFHDLLLTSSNKLLSLPLNFFSILFASFIILSLFNSSFFMSSSNFSSSFLSLGIFLNQS